MDSDLSPDPCTQQPRGDTHHCRSSIWLALTFGVTTLQFKYHFIDSAQLLSECRWIFRAVLINIDRDSLWTEQSGGGGYLIIFPCCWKLTITPSECCHHQAAISHLSLVKLQFLCCDNSKNSPEQMVHIVMVSCVHQNHIRCYNSITDSPSPFVRTDENYFPTQEVAKIFPCVIKNISVSICLRMWVLTGGWCWAVW